MDRAEEIRRRVHGDPPQERRSPSIHLPQQTSSLIQFHQPTFYIIIIITARIDYFYSFVNQSAFLFLFYNAGSSAVNLTYHISNKSHRINIINSISPYQPHKFICSPSIPKSFWMNVSELDRFVNWNRVAIAGNWRDRSLPKKKITVRSDGIEWPHIHAALPVKLKAKIKQHKQLWATNSCLTWFFVRLLHYIITLECKPSIKLKLNHMGVDNQSAFGWRGEKRDVADGERIVQYRS